MAIYHLTAKTGSRGGGQSAKAKVDYIQRAGQYTRDREELEHTQSGNMPAWAQAAADYWDAADLYERANGRLFKELEFALPVELSPTERRELACSFAERLTEAERLPYTLAIHSGKGENPHCHLMISERINDGLDRDPALYFKRYNAKHPDRGGAQKTEALKPTEWLEQTRAAWSEHANRALEQAGQAARIDHRTLEAQGITDREPTRHLGPAAVGYERRTGEPSRRRLDMQAEASARLAAAQQAGLEERALEREIISLSGDIRAAKAERERAEEPTERERLAQERIEQRRLAMAEVLAEALAPQQAPAAPPPRTPTPQQASHQEQADTPPPRPALTREEAIAAARRRDALIAQAAAALVQATREEAARQRREAERALEEMPRRPRLWGQRQWEAERTRRENEADRARHIEIDLGDYHKREVQERARLLAEARQDIADPELAEQAAMGNQILAEELAEAEAKREQRRLARASQQARTEPGQTSRSGLDAPQPRATQPAHQARASGAARTSPGERAPDDYTRIIEGAIARLEQAGASKPVDDRWEDNAVRVLETALEEIQRGDLKGALESVRIAAEIESYDGMADGICARAERDFQTKRRDQERAQKQTQAKGRGRGGR